jgi:hypothetical protein
VSLFPASVEAALTGVPRSKGSKVFVVDAVNGSNSNPGTKWDLPLATVEAAYALCTDKKNDVVLLVGNGTSNQAAAAITWAKDFTHLIGLSAPGLLEPRSRIKSPAALATTPFITWQGVGCVVKNMSFWHESSNAASLVCFHISGGRNYFENCQFAGAIGANAVTGARSLKISGSASYAGGNTFKGCVIGNDTIAVPDGAAGLEFVLGAMHNVFDDCLFAVETPGTTYVHVSAALSTALGRLNMFRRCVFINEGDGVQAEVVNIGQAVGNHQYIYMLDCWKYGATDWDHNNRGVINNGEYATSITGTNAANTLLVTSG